jgi:hypothetical protein
MHDSHGSQTPGAIVRPVNLSPDAPQAVETCVTAVDTPEALCDAETFFSSKKSKTIMTIGQNIF